MTDIADEAWIHALPKAEVHCHLEGCLPHELVMAAAARHGAAPPDHVAFEQVPGGTERPVVRSLAELLAYLDWSCALVDTPEELELAAYRIAERAHASGTLHTDVIVNPTHWRHWQRRLPEMVDALDAGFRAGEHDLGTTATLCVSLKRTQSRSEALEVVDTLVELAHPRVSALSIDGNEAGGAESHNDRFAPTFERAAAAGLRRCAHAGESSGAGGVREAIEMLGAERIDHGIRSLEDPAVVALLADRQIPLDVCPTSNVVLGVVPSMEAHPLRELRSHGVACSLNTDDPLLYGIDLAHEYAVAAEAFSWGRDELGEMARVGIEASFCGDERKATLLGLVARFLAL